VTPRVSVVVPTYRRTDLLERCLAALAAQRLPPEDYEIVVVHDGPSAAARPTVQAVAPGAVYLELTERRGPAAARNAGWRAARAPIVAFTDDDTIPDAGWLAAGLAALEEGVDAVQGRIAMPIGRRPTDYERDAAGLATAGFVTANCFCRKDVLERVGGFDERFELAWREDSDLYFRLLEAGARIRRADDAVVVHPIRPAGWGVSVKQQRKIVFDALLYKKHPRLYRQHIRRAARWDYYASVAALAVAIAAAGAGAPEWAYPAAAVWLLLTLCFALQRLRQTAKSPSHVAEMLVTSALIPPVAVFWRAAGALRFKVMFV
jgi:GT2 family glycosyltransferase